METESLWECAAREHPELAAHRPAFEARLPQLQQPPAFPGDLLLASAALAGDPLALEQLELLLRQARVAASRVSSSAAALDDVLQQVRVKLMAGTAVLDQFSGSGPLQGWLRAIVVRTALAVQREDGHEIPEEEHRFLSLVAKSFDDSTVARNSAARQVEAAVRAAIDRLEPRARTLLRLHHFDGVTLDRLANIYNVHRATAARWLADARSQIADAARDALRKDLALVDSELVSLLAAAQPELQVSFRQLFEPNKDEE